MEEITDIINTVCCNLVHKGLVEEVWSPDAQIEDVDFLQNGVVEGVQEPGGVGHLVVGEDAEDVEVSVRCEPEALGRAGDDAGNKGPVTETVLQAFLVSPV